MFDFSDGLGWTFIDVWAIVLCFPFFSLELGIALGAMGDIRVGGRVGVSSGEVYAHNFGDDFAPFLNKNGIAHTHVEAFNFIGVVEAGSLYCGSEQLHRL